MPEYVQERKRVRIQTERKRGDAELCVKPVQRRMFQLSDVVVAFFIFIFFECTIEFIGGVCACVNYGTCT